ncbi:MAG: glycosyltransferase [Acidobacteria bacterium]|jgi:glycosyltransferase involved in cell wall biosynthesis|nr:glycosyltransferase [Acidobacteriota bacterium]
MLLSVLVPVYNERTVVRASLSKVLEAPLPDGVEREVILVDDCSTDGTGEILEEFVRAHPDIRLFRKRKNEGKGAAIRTALSMANGDFVLVQDADLEYDPAEYPTLLKPLLEGRADAVFGSRYMAGEQRRVLRFWHSMINKTITLICNMFSDLHCTDIETCYKVFRTDLLKSIPIRSDRFGFEPEITMKTSKRKLRVYEVPISYHGRTFEEGKKIGWKDGVKALGVIFYFWLIDDLYAENYGRQHLNNLTGTPQYIAWATALLRPHLGDRVVELGAGIGDFTGRLMGRKLAYYACESEPVYLHALLNRFLKTPSVHVLDLPLADAAAFAQLPAEFDTALVINSLELVADPAAILSRLTERLAPGGNVVLLVPHGPALFGSLDRELGHLRRFSRADITRLFTEAGLAVESLRSYNRLATVSWWINSRLLRSRRISRLTLKLFDKTIWLWRLLDPLVPLPGLSLIAVGRKR